MPYELPDLIFLAVLNKSIYTLYMEYSACVYVVSAEVHTIQLQLSVVQFLQHCGRCKITTIHVLRHFLVQFCIALGNSFYCLVSRFMHKHFSIFCSLLYSQIHTCESLVPSHEHMGSPCIMLLFTLDSMLHTFPHCAVMHAMYLVLRDVLLSWLQFDLDKTACLYVHLVW